MSQEKQDNTTEQVELWSYDPMVVVLDVLRRWYLIVMAAVLVGMGAFVGADLTYVPDYTATATLVVSVQESSGTVYQNLSAASSLASVFSEVLNSSLLREKILEAVDLPSFDGTIQAFVVEETNLLNLKVTDHDPRTAFLVAQAILEHHHEVSDQVMGDTVLDVLQKPVVPAAPSNPPHPASTMKKGMVLGGAVMAVLLCVLSVMRDTIRSRQEAEQKLGTRVLGEIRYERKVNGLRRWLKHKKTGILITNPTTSFGFLEEIRKLRRQVEYRMPEGGKVLVVSSTLENEGKSTIAVNLALALTRKQKRVLLVDADLRRPACHKLLDLPRREEDLVSVLTDGRRLEEAAFAWGREKGLYTLLSWESRADAMDLLSSKKMEKVLDEARTSYDFVILDTPPMTVGPDAESLADLADGCLLVVRQNIARTQSINRALDALQGTDSKLLGCVLNGVCMPLLSGDGGYDTHNYGAGYGHYGHYGRYGAYGTGRDGHRQDREVGTDRES